MLKPRGSFLPSPDYFLALAFGGLPIGSSPGRVVQYLDLHFGHSLGLPATFFTHWWPQRRQLQIILFGIAMTSNRIARFPIHSP